MSSSHRQGLTIILTCIPPVVAALNSSLTISPASESCGFNTGKSCNIPIGDLGLWGTNQTGPYNHRQGKALDSENHSKNQVFNCSLTYRYVNMNCFYTRHIKKKKVTKG